MAQSPDMIIRCYPDRVLRRKCRPIRRVDDEVLARAQRMLDMMYEAEGLGLAGPQVGWTEQILTLDVEQQHEGERIFVNPRIVEREGSVELEEGCLSLPGVRLQVPRAARAPRFRARARPTFPGGDTTTRGTSQDSAHLSRNAAVPSVLPSLTTTISHWSPGFIS